MQYRWNVGPLLRRDCLPQGTFSLRCRMVLLIPLEPGLGLRQPASGLQFAAGMQ